MFGGAYSFAKTPLKAAHAPLVMAKKSHAVFVRGIDMLSYAIVLRDLVMCGGGEVDAAAAGTGPRRA